MKIVAVTSCPTGIAHTYMAAEAIQRAAKAKGHEIFVETQGAGGLKPVPADFLASADVVIFAADVEVRDKERFASLPTVVGTVKKAIKDAAGLVTEAEQLVGGVN
jgi:fructose PTS system EIIBC or EIIC component